METSALCLDDLLVRKFHASGWRRGMPLRALSLTPHERAGLCARLRALEAKPRLKKDEQHECGALWMLLGVEAMRMLRDEELDWRLILNLTGAPSAPASARYDHIEEGAAHRFGVRMLISTGERRRSRRFLGTMLAHAGGTLQLVLQLVGWVPDELTWSQLATWDEEAIGAWLQTQSALWITPSRPTHRLLIDEEGRLGLAARLGELARVREIVLTHVEAHTSAEHILAELDRLGLDPNALLGVSGREEALQLLAALCGVAAQSEGGPIIGRLTWCVFAQAQTVALCVAPPAALRHAVADAHIARLVLHAGVPGHTLELTRAARRDVWEVSKRAIVAGHIGASGAALREVDSGTIQLHLPLEGGPACLFEFANGGAMVRRVEPGKRILCVFDMGVRVIQGPPGFAPHPDLERRHGRAAWVGEVKHDGAEFVLEDGERWVLKPGAASLKLTSRGLLTAHLYGVGGPVYQRSPVVASLDRAVSGIYALARRGAQRWREVAQVEVFARLEPLQLRDASSPGEWSIRVTPEGDTQQARTRFTIAPVKLEVSEETDASVLTLCALDPSFTLEDEDGTRRSEIVRRIAPVTSPERYELRGWSGEDPVTLCWHNARRPFSVTLVTERDASTLHNGDKIESQTLLNATRLDVVGAPGSIVRLAIGTLHKTAHIGDDGVGSIDLARIGALREACEASASVIVSNVRVGGLLGELRLKLMNEARRAARGPLAWQIKGDPYVLELEPRSHDVTLSLTHQDAIWEPAHQLEVKSGESHVMLPKDLAPGIYDARLGEQTGTVEIWNVDGALRPHPLTPCLQSTSGPAAHMLRRTLLRLDPAEREVCMLALYRWANSFGNKNTARQELIYHALWPWSRALSASPDDPLAELAKLRRRAGRLLTLDIFDLYDLSQLTAPLSDEDILALIDELDETRDGLFYSFCLIQIGRLQKMLGGPNMINVLNVFRRYQQLSIIAPLTASDLDYIDGGDGRPSSTRAEVLRRFIERRNEALDSWTRLQQANIAAPPHNPAIHTALQQHARPALRRDEELLVAWAYALHRERMGHTSEKAVTKAQRDDLARCAAELVDYWLNCWAAQDQDSLNTALSGELSWRP